MRYFIGLYVAHLCGDVLAYFPALAEAKRARINNHKITAITLHCLVHGLLVLFWFLVLGLDRVLPAIIYIFSIHFVIDLSRIYLEGRLFGENELLILERRALLRWITSREKGDVHHFMKDHFVKWATINIIDQGAHLLSIVIFVSIIHQAL